jgi:hypothetical protein
MGKRETYREQLQQLDQWEDFLLENSGLPGPRGNLELAQATADLIDKKRIRMWLGLSPEQAPTNSPEEFLVFCAAVGLGRLLAEGDLGPVRDLKRLASDPRWRTREAVAMALQRWGQADFNGMFKAIEPWSQEGPYEQRAVVAGLCEPVLLRDPSHAKRVLRVMDRITASLPAPDMRKNDAFQALRKGLAYGWSVAVCASPEAGKVLMEKWFRSADGDVIWIMKENLKKNRLQRLDPGWVKRWTKQLSKG